MINFVSSNIQYYFLIVLSSINWLKCRNLFFCGLAGSKYGKINVISNEQGVLAKIFKNTPTNAECYSQVHQRQHSTTKQHNASKKLSKSLYECQSRLTNAQYCVIVQLIMKNQFPIAQFRLALQDTSKIQTLLKPFLAEYKNNNMFFIVHTVQQLYRCLTEKCIEIELVFNCLFAVKAIVDRADFVILSFIETELLSKILQIACFQTNTQKKNRGDSYFTSKGFQGQKNLLEYYGLNFVRIACEFIMVAAQIKPNKLVYNQQIKDPSDFSLALRKLKLKGFMPYEKLAFYKENDIKDSRNTFVSNLRNYYKDIIAISQHTSLFIQSFLEKGTGTSMKINPMKLAEKGQATLSSLVIQACVKSLKSKNLKQRRRALHLFNDFIRWGDILPYFQINLMKSVKEIIEQMVNFASQLNFASHSGYNNNEIEKRLYYSYLLQSVRFWSQCYPLVLNCPKKPTYIKSLVDQLDKRGFQLPNAASLQALTSEFQQNIKKRQQVNNRIKRRYFFEQFRAQIRKAKNIIKRIQSDQSKIKICFAYLTEFQREYDIKISFSYFNEPDIEYITIFGSPIIQFVQEIRPYLQKYIEKRSSHQLLIEQMNLIKKQVNYNHLHEAPKYKDELLCNSLSDKISKQLSQINGDESLGLMKFDFLQSKLPKKVEPNSKGNICCAKQEADQSSEEGESVYCFLLSSTFKSKVSLSDKEASTYKSIETHKPTQDLVCQINLNLNSKKKQENNVTQISQIKEPLNYPREQSENQQIARNKNKSFLHHLAADKHEVVHKRIASLKLFSPQKQGILKSSQQIKASQINSVNNKFKQLYKLTNSSLKSKVNYPCQSQNSIETLKLSSNKKTTTGPSSDRLYQNLEFSELNNLSNNLKLRNWAF